MEPRVVNLSPSLYAADPLRLGEQVEALAPHVASFHVDVMDGSFAPAFGFGERVVRELVARTSVPVDVHLMADNPGRWVRAFADAGASGIAFHLEAAEDPRAIAAEVLARGALPYLAVQPTTALASALPFLHVVHGILLLTAPAGGGADRSGGRWSVRRRGSGAHSHAFHRHPSTRGSTPPSRMTTSGPSTTS